MFRSRIWVAWVLRPALWLIWQRHHDRWNVLGSSFGSVEVVQGVWILFRVFSRHRGMWRHIDVDSSALSIRLLRYLVSFHQNSIEKYISKHKLERQRNIPVP